MTQAGQPAGVAHKGPDRTQRCIGSALWASWADATGFISELTDERGLKRRLGGHTLSGPVTWHRRLGGKFGPTLRLPAGCYSDDTQLRLATCRALGPAGFDAEAFARIELTVWPAYALGGGRATRAAAQGHTRNQSSWYANPYPGWLESGGNGAVMRIQPHVWAAAEPDRPRSWMADMFANAVSTHSHPRALLACALHALALGRTLTSGRVPGPDLWPQLLHLADASIETMQARVELAEYWNPLYDQQAKDAGLPTFTQAWQNTVQEVARQLTQIKPLTEQLAQTVVTAPDLSRKAHRRGEQYEELVSILSLDVEARRGSGTATAVAALAIAAALQDEPVEAVLLACRRTKTDTDTIATMVGALVGATGGALPPELPLADDGEDPSTVGDVEYQTAVAIRCAQLAAPDSEHDVTAFGYPDLLTWSAPTTQLDAIGRGPTGLVLAGLGTLSPLGAATTDNRGNQWQWHRLEYGQTVLVKMRSQPAQLKPTQVPGQAVRAGFTVQQDADRPVRSRNTKASHERTERRDSERRRRNALAHLDPDATRSDQRRSSGEKEQPALFDGSGVPVSSSNLPIPNAAGVDALLDWTRAHNYEDKAVGYALRRLAETLTDDAFRSAVERLRNGILDAKAFDSVTPTSSRESLDSANPVRGIALMAASFVIKKSASGQFHFILKAGNGEIIATSETYTTKDAAKTGIESLRVKAADAEVVDEA